MRDLFTPTPPPRALENIFTPTPSPKRSLKEISTPTPSPKRRLSAASDDEPANKRFFIERGDTNASADKQLVPVVSRAEGAQARAEMSQGAAEGTSESDSDEDIFQDAEESLNGFGGEGIQDFGDEGLFGLSQQELRARCVTSRRVFTPPLPGVGKVDIPHKNGSSQYTGGMDFEQSQYEHVSRELHPEQENQEAAELRSMGIVQEGMQGVEALDPPEEEEIEPANSWDCDELPQEPLGKPYALDAAEESTVQDQIVEDTDHEQDLHEKYFGKSSSSAAAQNDSEDDSDDDSLIITGEKQGRRLSTPPLPKYSNNNNTTKPTPPTKRRMPSKLDRKYAPRTDYTPDLALDVSEDLIAHGRFHFRAASYIPRIANIPQNLSFDWSRRYWIAVLLPSKLPKNVNSEKDFIWMKGNRHTSVRTVWNSYLTTTFEDPDQKEMMLGRYKLEMGERMEELDFWADHLVVFRVVEKRDVGREARSLVQGVERYDVGGGEVIELD